MKRLAASALFLFIGVALVTSRSAPDASSTAPAQTEAPRAGVALIGGREVPSGGASSLPAVALRSTSGVDATELALVASVSLRGWATWCAPTPTRCQGWGGDAHLGAVPSFTYGATPYNVTVCHEGACTYVRVVSYCACGDRQGIPTVIDLSPAAFRDLAPLSAGVIDVSIELGGAATLPPTDAE